MVNAVVLYHSFSEPKKVPGTSSSYPRTVVLYLKSLAPLPFRRCYCYRTLFSSRLRISPNAGCSAVPCFVISTYYLSVAVTFFCSRGSRLLIYLNFSVEISSPKVLDPVLHTVVHRQLLTNSGVSNRGNLQQLLLFGVLCRLPSCGPRGLHLRLLAPVSKSSYCSHLLRDIAGRWSTA